jgi:hypothetical protein
LKYPPLLSPQRRCRRCCCCPPLCQPLPCRSRTQAAKGVSAKSHDFAPSGNETHTDYTKTLDSVLKKHGYLGYIGVEYEGMLLSEADGIKATAALPKRAGAALAKK